MPTYEFQDRGQAHAVKSRSTATGQRNHGDRMTVPDVRPDSSLKSSPDSLRCDRLLFLE